jgi:polar amino acid transport system substrate-binding protein
VSLLRRHALLGLLFATLALAGCAPVPAAPDAQVRQALAPTGPLRVGVYAGSPTSLVRHPETQVRAGVALDLGEAMGRELQVPVRVVEFSRVAQVLEALKAGEVDVTFTNATEARARDVDFTPPLVRLELGYLVPAGSPLQTADEIDMPKVSVGVSQGSSSQGVLSQRFKQAAVVPVPDLKAAQQRLANGELQAFATNKGILFELSAALPGARVLPGRWGLEHLALAIPKGRDAGMPWLREFAKASQHNGVLAAAVARSGLRGMAAD